MILGLGGNNPFPLQLGGGDSVLDAEHQALLDLLAPGWEGVDETHPLWAETRAEALAVTMVWATNRRVANQMQPLKMTELLPDFEEVTHQIPSAEDSLVTRRRRIAGKLRGIVRNAFDDLKDVASRVMGPNFVALTAADPADEIVYWPGINPGAPGYEWSSNRAIVAVHCNMNGLGDDDFDRKRAVLADALDHARPAWLTYQIGVGSGIAGGFIVDKGICDITIV
jgi:hypothetical protein